MPPPLPTSTSDVSALVQQFLLYQGARYVGRVTEDNWKHVPVTLQVPGRRLADGDLPGGAWMVVPWDLPSYDQLVQWLGRLRLAGPMPRVVVLVTAGAVVPADVMARLGVLAGTELIGISAPEGQAAGGPTAGLLQTVFDPETQAVLETVSPLQHLVALGDPRDPEVFYERLRWASRGVPVTIFLVTVNVAIYLVMLSRAFDYPILAWAGRELREIRDLPGLEHLQRVVFEGFHPRQLVRWGANLATQTVGSEEAWRLLSCTFLHANLLHIGMNMLVLRSIGVTAELLFGSWMFLALYVLSGLGGSIASLAWTLSADPTLPSVGASGAVFGVMGGLLGFALARRDSVPRTVYKGLLRSGLIFTAINISLGLTMRAIDNAAHIGGLLVGFVTGVVLSRDLPPAPQPSPVWRVVVLSACLGGLGLFFQLAATLVE